MEEIGVRCVVRGVALERVASHRDAVDRTDRRRALNVADIYSVIYVIMVVLRFYRTIDTLFAEKLA